MAVEPLYNVKADLIEKLRMTGTSDDDTLSVIDQVISDVRLSFYNRLTPARAIEIAGFSSEENPTSTDGILRGVAEVTEVYWVIYKLVCILPHMFIETQFPIQNSFDDVPITRDSDSISKFRECLWTSIEEGLGKLVSPVDDSVSGGFQSFSTGRVDTNGDANPFILDDNFVGLPRNSSAW